jgi:diaminopimelate decarboxylase
VRQDAGGELEPADVVGPVCETGDVLAKAVLLPHLKPDDLLAIETAGAYGAVMSSTYNTRLPVAEVMVNGAQFGVIRPRPDYDAVISLDRMPAWLENSHG